MLVEHRYCNGTGIDPNSEFIKKACKGCKGSGRVNIPRFKNTTPFECGFCSGSGVDPNSEFIKNQCEHCKGSGLRAKI